MWLPPQNRSPTTTLLPDPIVIVATEAKIAGLQGAPLRVDTGDPDLDASLAGWTRVTVGFNREIVYRIQ